MPLSKVNIKNTQHEIDGGTPVLHVNDPHALIMAAGYLKYNLAKKNQEGIYFRGQRKIYASLPPTAYRSAKTNKAQAAKNAAIAEIISEYKKTGKIFNTFGDYAHEPLLQHYGIETTWVDVVDNLWVALWFACYKSFSTGESGKFLHFERRLTSDPDKYAYILLIGADIGQTVKGQPGYFHGPNTELVDLRIAAPSIFLRPHAQHGLLFRKKGNAAGARPADYADQVRGVIRVDLTKALDWLGSGTIVNTHSIFPPPYYDNGYSILLTCGVPGNSVIGAISHIGA
ncbi:hypothetical protein RugamoR57_37670 [Duganella caerulea]|uniref:FRG domain-containing protein n=1 Tax=Duganella caerulea TaxID=2885762 RepID=UPI0030E98132